MAERKAVNKYYPPDWDPSKGSVNKHVGQHPLRERAKKLSQGILVIRFEMPYNIWCGGCGNHIGMGVRYNAEKKKVGNYYTTPIYRFRMKCHLCDNYLEIETDPKNCDYTIVSGARRKEERWDPSATENVQATDHAEKQKLIDDAMFKLEHGEKDKRKSKAAIPGLVQIKDIQSQWKDDFALNQMLRKKFRQEKKVILEKEEKDQEIKDKGSLDIDLVNEDPEDIKLAKRIRFHSTGFQEDQRKRRLQIKARPMFSDKGTASKDTHRASLLEKRQRILINKPDITSSSLFSKNSKSLGIIRKQNKDKVCSANIKHVNEINQAENDGEGLLSARKMTVKLRGSGKICEKQATSEDSWDICEKEATSEDSGDICITEATSEDSGDLCIIEAEDSGDICVTEATSEDSGDICEREATSENSEDICGKEAISEPEVGESDTQSADSKTHTRAGFEVDFVSRTDSQAVKADINNLHSKTSKQNISLISEMYNDTDSDSSK